MKVVGLISVFVLVASLIYTQIKWGPDYNKTFSRLIAQKRSSTIYYFVIFSIFLSFFSLFMVISFIPQFNLPKIFTWIYFLGVVAQFICVTIPEVGEYKTKIHLTAAVVMSVSALAQIVLLVLFAQLSLASLIACILSLAVMVTTWLIIIFKHNLIKYELALQSVYFAGYLGALMFVSYVM